MKKLVLLTLAVAFSANALVSSHVARTTSIMAGAMALSHSRHHKTSPEHITHCALGSTVTSLANPEIDTTNCVNQNEEKAEE